MVLNPQAQPFQPAIGLQPGGVGPSAGDSQLVQQFQQICAQLEQVESRHAQMLQQIQADEQFAAQQLRQLSQLSQQIVRQSQPYYAAGQAHQVPQYQAQSFAAFPRV